MASRRRSSSGPPRTSNRRRADLTLYFSEASGEIHGPIEFAPDEQVEQMLPRLEEFTFRSRCVDNKANQWLAHAEISTSSGIILNHGRYLNEYPVCNGDTLTVVVVDFDDQETRSESQGDCRVP